MGSFLWSLEVVLDLILRLFRGPYAQRTEHAKSTFYLHSEHFGWIFLDFRTLENIVFKVLLAFEGHFDCIFTVKS